MEIRPFLTYYRDSLDYNVNDSKNEFDLMNQRNIAIEGFLQGEIAEDYLFDLLDSQNIEPQDYIESVQHELQYFLRNPHQLY